MSLTPLRPCGGPPRAPPSPGRPAPSVTPGGRRSGQPGHPALTARSGRRGRRLPRPRAREAPRGRHRGPPVGAGTTAPSHPAIPPHHHPRHRRVRLLAADTSAQGDRSGAQRRGHRPGIRHAGHVRTREGILPPTLPIEAVTPVVEPRRPGGSRPRGGPGPGAVWAGRSSPPRSHRRARATARRRDVGAASPASPHPHRPGGDGRMPPAAWSPRSIHTARSYSARLHRWGLAPFVPQLGRNGRSSRGPTRPRPAQRVETGRVGLAHPTDVVAPAMTQRRRRPDPLGDPACGVRGGSAQWAYLPRENS